MFLALNCPKSFDSSVLTNMNLVYDEQDNEKRSTKVFHHANHKAVDDSFMNRTNKVLYLFEGIILNDSDLMNRYAVCDVKTLLKSALQDNSMQITRELHGQFCGLYIDFEQKLIRAMTNQINSSRVFYYNKDEIFIVSTSIKQIIRLLKANRIETSIDEVGAKMLLTYGFMLADYTTISDIRHLQAGECISNQGGLLKLEAYHRFNNETKYQDLNKAIPVLHELFSRSVKMSFEKDLSHGRKHLAFLSGGLDSRQVVMTAHQLGYRDLACLNFSEPGYMDEIIARKIAKLLDYRLSFYSLQNGSYLSNLEENLIYNEGQILLHGAAHLYAAISSIDLSGFGLFHSGQLGDAALGSFLKTGSQSKVNLAQGAYSKRVFDSLYPHIKHIENNYENNEMYLHYNRAFNGAINGDYACAEFSYSISPFADPEFYQFCLNISPTLRSHNLLYNTWIQTYNQLGAKIKWEKTGLNLYASKHLVQLNRIVRAVDRRLRKLIFNKGDLTGMNPFDKWWLQNPALRDKINNISPLQEEIGSQVSSELKNDVLAMFQSNTVSEKLQAYSLIAGLNYLHNND